MRLHALSLQNGADAVTPAEVSASVMLAGNTGTATTSAEHNFNRAALLEASGSIYVALGSHCDAYASTTHGWVLAYSSTSLAPAGTVINSTNGQSTSYLGVPWMSGYGPAADGAGNVYFSTGNGPWDGVNAFSMSDIKVPGNLDIANGSYFTQIDEAALSSKDGDLASGGVMLLPDGLSATYPHLMIQGGKTGRKYLLNRDRLGGQQPGDAGAVWQGNIAGGFGGPAFYQDAMNNSYVIYGNGDPLASYRFDAASSSLSVASAVKVAGGCLECRSGGSQPVVSSNGTLPGRRSSGRCRRHAAAEARFPCSLSTLRRWCRSTPAPPAAGIPGADSIGSGAPIFRRSSLTEKSTFRPTAASPSSVSSKGRSA